MNQTPYTPKQKAALKKACAMNCRVYYDRPYLHVKGYRAAKLFETFAEAFGAENVKTYQARIVMFSNVKETALKVRR